MTIFFGPHSAIFIATRRQNRAFREISASGTATPKHPYFMKYHVLLAGILLAIASCTSVTPQPVPTDTRLTAVFMENYQPYCGQTFAGYSSYTDLGEDSPLQDARLTMRITDCSSDEVRIHFMVEQDSSRTWILSFQDDALRLAHDHRYPDGREYEANFYGGIAMDNTNQAFAHYPEGKRASTSQLFFPADPQTLSDRPTREINVWSKAFDHEAQTYYYRLYLRGELRYEAVFDLSTPRS